MTDSPLDTLQLSSVVLPLSSRNTLFPPTFQLHVLPPNMTSADIPFDNTYADRQINHHQRMLKQFQMGTKPRVEHSFSASLSDPSIPVDGCSSLLPDSPTSGDSYSLPSPPPLLINLADPYLAPQKAQQVVLPFTCLDKGVYGSLVHPSPVNSTWLSQPYYGNVQQLANSSQGLGLGKLFQTTIYLTIRF